LLKLLQRNIQAVNEEDEYGETPLHLACMAGHTNCVKALINNGASVRLLNPLAQAPPPSPSVAIAGPSEPQRDDFSALCGPLWPTGVRGPSASQWVRLPSPSFFCRGKLNSSLCSLFASPTNRANVMRKDNEHWTPLHYAAINAQTECASLLMDKGMFASLSCSKTSLTTLVGSFHSLSLDWRAWTGADPNALTLDHNTPLHLAAAAGVLDCVILLVILPSREPLGFILVTHE